MSLHPTSNKTKGAMLGAAFLMATSAIGPGFLNNTAAFTAALKTNFGFIIVASILLDMIAQLNIWRVLAFTGNKAQDLANRLLPGLGVVLAVLVSFGGMVFNIGNIAGCGLGLEVLTGIDSRTGAAMSCLIALLLFWQKEAGKWIDWLVKILGAAMIAATVYIVIAARPPVLTALQHSVFPEKTDILMIVTLVGGTVGGYISFAGIHRLLEAGVQGEKSLGAVNKTAATGILVTAVMRYALFLAVLGVVSKGFIVSSQNPAASVFKEAAGLIGFYFFGLVLWCAAITSVIGASYTSVSFLQTLHPFFQKHRRLVTFAFIIISAIAFIVLKQPPSLLLVLAGAFNGILLPIGLAVILLAAMRKKIMGTYRHPLWLQVSGWIVVLLMSWMSYLAILQTLS